MQKSILLVDDDLDMRLIVERWLSREYKMTAASSGQEALDHLQNEIPDLVLLDYAMPGLDGTETLREIRSNEALSALPVIFLTGMESPENADELSALRPAGFWSKNMGKKELLASLTSFFQSE